MKLLETRYLVDYEKERDAAGTFYRAHEHEAFAASTVSLFELAFGVVRDGEGDLDTLQASLQWVDFLDFSVPDAFEAATIQTELRPPASGFRSAIRWSPGWHEIVGRRSSLATVTSTGSRDLPWKITVRRRSVQLFLDVTRPTSPLSPRRYRSATSMDRSPPTHAGTDSPVAFSSLRPGRWT